MTEAVCAQKVLKDAQKFIDFWFNNPGTDRPEITIPAQEDNTDLSLIRGIKALAKERDDLQSELEALRLSLMPKPSSGKMIIKDQTND